MKRILTFILAASVAVFSFAGFAMAADDQAAGFTEIPIFEDEELAFINLSAVYFQPVPMAPGQESIEDFDLHLEADIAALENDLGYGVGDWVPYLTVDYKVVGSDGEVAAEGSFMPMAASDGPHYGANIKLNGDGVYTVTFTVKFPDSSTYLIHTDGTGPAEHEFPDAIVYTYDSWQFTDGAWAE